MAVTKTGGPTAKLYRGQLFPMDTKDVKGEYDKRKKDKEKVKEKGQDELREPGDPNNRIPGVSGSGEPQPDKGGTLNDEKSADKLSKQAEKDQKEADKGVKKNT